MGKGGKFAVIRIINVLHGGEYTNVGVILFDEDGQQIGAKMDGPDRAIRRGDTREECRCALLDILPNRPALYPDVASIHRAWESSGHWMSSIQVGELNGCLLTDNMLERLYAWYVEGCSLNEPKPEAN